MTAGDRLRRWWFRVLGRTLNPVALRAARSGRGPFALVRHVGRTTGRPYETPLIVAPVPEGFVAELTYGRDVAWYRNIVTAGRCTIVHDGREYEIDRITDLDRASGLRAYGMPRSLILRLLRRHDFLLLHRADARPISPPSVAG